MLGTLLRSVRLHVVMIPSKGLDCARIEMATKPDTMVVEKDTAAATKSATMSAVRVESNILGSTGTWDDVIE